MIAKENFTSGSRGALVYKKKGELLTISEIELIGGNMQDLLNAGLVEDADQVEMVEPKAEVQAVEKKTFLEKVLPKKKKK